MLEIRKILESLIFLNEILNNQNKNISLLSSKRIEFKQELKNVDGKIYDLWSKITNYIKRFDLDKYDSSEIKLLIIESLNFFENHINKIFEHLDDDETKSKVKKILILVERSYNNLNDEKNDKDDNNNYFEICSVLSENNINSIETPNYNILINNFNSNAMQRNKITEQDRKIFNKLNLEYIFKNNINKNFDSISNLIMKKLMRETINFESMKLDEIIALFKIQIVNMINHEWQQPFDKIKKKLWKRLHFLNFINSEKKDYKINILIQLIKENIFCFNLNYDSGVFVSFNNFAKINFNTTYNEFIKKMNLKK